MDEYVELSYIKPRMKSQDMQATAPMGHKHSSALKKKKKHIWRKNKQVQILQDQEVVLWMVRRTQVKMLKLRYDSADGIV